MERTECEIWSRTVGYLRPVEQWNEGKQQEFKDRKVFKIDYEALDSQHKDKDTGSPV